MSLVLDSSTAVAFVIEDERTPAVTSLVQRVAEAGGVVPSLWRLEVANALMVAVKRGRITAAIRDGGLADFRELPIEVDGETDQRAWSSTLRLAERVGLTLYDAAYLELADRRGLPIATLDQRLRAAAAAVGVGVCRP